MKYKAFHNGPLKNDDEEYWRERKTINAEELGEMFETETNDKLKQLIKFLKSYKRIQEMIPWAQLDTKLSKDLLLELTKNFFQSVNTDFSTQVKEVVDQEGQTTRENYFDKDIVFDIIEDSNKGLAGCQRFDFGPSIDMPDFMLENIRKKSGEEEYNKWLRRTKPSTQFVIKISTNGCIGDLYNLTHELTHYLILKNKKTARTLDEVGPQCMERILDDYLLTLSDEDLAKYQFDRSKLKNDIMARKAITFISRYNITTDFNTGIRNNKNGPEEEENVQYLLSQLFAGQLSQYSEEERKKMVVEAVKGISLDDFDGVSKIFNIDWKNPESRKKLVSTAVGETKQIINYLGKHPEYGQTQDESEETR